MKATPSTIPGNVSKKARKTVKKIKLPWSNLYMFFPAEVTDAEVEQTIYDALDAYTRKKKIARKNKLCFNIYTMNGSPNYPKRPLI